MKELFLYILFPIASYLVGRIHEMFCPGWPFQTRKKEPVIPEPTRDPLGPPDICTLKRIIEDAYQARDYDLVKMCEQEIDRLTQERKV